ncbi:MAG: FadR/GntR family transcriptional regulator [Streptosporangiales bacterium]
MAEIESRTRLSSRPSVADQIKDYMLRKRLRPGELLPTESELCEAVGASRSSVREAIKTLRALDIIEVRHGHGSYVGHMSLNALVESLAFRGLLSRTDDHRVLSELVEVRQTLTQGFARQIIETMTDERRARLATLARSMQSRAAEGDAFIEEDREFHLTLMEPLGNELVMQLTAAFWDVQAIIAPTLEATVADASHTADLHMSIVESTTSGDSDALRSAIAAHYTPVRNRIRALSDGESRTHQLGSHA